MAFQVLGFHTDACRMPSGHRTFGCCDPSEDKTGELARPHRNSDWKRSDDPGPHNEEEEREPMTKLNHPGPAESTDRCWRIVGRR